MRFTHPVLVSVGYLLLVVSVSVGMLACRQNTSPSKTSSNLVSVERGRYLTTVLACNDCHTPFVMGPKGPEPDMTRMLSGHPQDLVMPPPPVLPDGPWVWVGSGTNTAYAGPWGISYAFNLTPDENTGIGIWTEEMFIRALRLGRHMGQSRAILPPMPWPMYSHLTDEDLKSIYAFLRTIPAIKNEVPDPVIAEGFDGAE